MLAENPHWRDIARPLDDGLKDLGERWRAWCRAASMPPRHLFRADDHARLLSWMVLADFERRPNEHRPYDLQVLFIGSDIAQYFGIEGSHRLRLSEIGAPFANRWFAVADRVLAARQPCSFLGTPYLTGFDYANFELLLLPFSDSGTDITSMLATFAMNLMPPGG